eukprot:557620-Amphidinium_carterae.1
MDPPEETHVPTEEAEMDDVSGKKTKRRKCTVVPPTAIPLSWSGPNMDSKKENWDFAYCVKEAR